MPVDPYAQFAGVGDDGYSATDIANMLRDAQREGTPFTTVGTAQGPMPFNAPPGSRIDPQTGRIYGPYGPAGPYDVTRPGGVAADPGLAGRLRTVPGLTYQEWLLMNQPGLAAGLIEGTAAPRARLAQMGLRPAPVSAQPGPGGLPSTTPLGGIPPPPIASAPSPTAPPTAPPILRPPRQRITAQYEPRTSLVEGTGGVLPPTPSPSPAPAPGATPAPAPGGAGPAGAWAMGTMLQNQDISALDIANLLGDINRQGSSFGPPGARYAGGRMYGPTGPIGPYDVRRPFTGNPEGYIAPGTPPVTTSPGTPYAAGAAGAGPGWTPPGYVRQVPTPLPQATPRPATPLPPPRPMRRTPSSPAPRATQEVEQSTLKLVQPEDFGDVGGTAGDSGPWPWPGPWPGGGSPGWSGGYNPFEPYAPPSPPPPPPSYPSPSGGPETGWNPPPPAPDEIPPTPPDEDIPGELPPYQFPPVIVTGRLPGGPPVPEPSPTGGPEGDPLPQIPPVDIPPWIPPRNRMPVYRVPPVVVTGNPPPEPEPEPEPEPAPEPPVIGQHPRHPPRVPFVPFLPQPGPPGSPPGEPPPGEPEPEPPNGGIPAPPHSPPPPVPPVGGVTSDAGTAIWDIIRRMVGWADESAARSRAYAGAADRGLGPAARFYQNLLSGTPSRVAEAAGPAFRSIASQFDLAQQSAGTNLPRGGGRNAIMAALPFKRAAAMSEVVPGLMAEAAKGSADVGGRYLAAVAQQLQAATGLTGQPLQQLVNLWIERNAGQRASGDALSQGFAQLIGPIITSILRRV